MKQFKILSVLIALTFLMVAPASAKGVSDDVVDLLKGKLKNVSTPADSVKVLYDIFDASPQSEKYGIAKQLLATGSRTDRMEEIYVDLLPQMAVIENRSEKELKKLLVEAEKINDTDHRKAIKLFINVRRAINEAFYVPVEDRRKILLKYAKADMVATGDLYQDILDLYRVVVFIGESSQSNLYLEYLTRLDNLISKLPKDCYYIRNMFYTTSAVCHTNNGNYQKAVEADRKLLEVISNLEERYKSQGRTYRNYDRFYYISYRRMLRNYKVLPLDEVKELYAKCAKIAEENEEVYKDFHNVGRTTAYRLMAENRYEEAVPKLMNALDKTDDFSLRISLVDMLVEAADSINDDNTLLYALKESNSLLKEKMKVNSDEAYRELQIRYDVNNLKSANSQLEIDKRDSDIATHQKLISVILAALLVMVIFLMLLYRKHFTLRQKVKDLKSENEKLHKNIEDILDDGTPSGTIDLHKPRE